jgi:hypothetical protein
MREFKDLGIRELRNLELIIPEFTIPKFSHLLQFMVPRNVAENTLRRGFAPKE